MPLQVEPGADTLRDREGPAVSLDAGKADKKSTESDWEITGHPEGRISVLKRPAEGEPPGPVGDFPCALFTCFWTPNPKCVMVSLDMCLCSVAWATR